MERRIREEDVTKFLIEWLEERGWTILCYDFPQSGTGVVIHPNDRETKNKGSFIPDIVAHKGELVLFFENKDHFAYDDFVKIEHLRATDEYSNDIMSLLSEIRYTSILYGVGMPESEIARKRSLENIALVDFAILVNGHGIVQIQENKIDI